MCTRGDDLMAYPQPAMPVRSLPLNLSPNLLRGSELLTSARDAAILHPGSCGDRNAYPSAMNSRFPTDSSKTPPPTLPDRKSTRLNSSHGYISYAVFCLKKK